MIDDFDIRQSLHYYTYIEHSKSLKMAGDENLNLFFSLIHKPQTENIRIKCNGLYNSTMLLYAVSVEIILKGRALFEEKENIKNGEIQNFREFLRKWGGHQDGHNYFKIIRYYNLSINENHQNFLEELKNFTSWAGRFPFPRNEDDILLFENGDGEKGKLSQKFQNGIDSFIEEQITQMRG